RRRLSGSPWQNDDGQPFLPLRPSEKYPLGILPVWGFLLFNCVIQLNQICHSLDTTTAHLHLSHGHQITRLAVSHALVENCTWDCYTRTGFFLRVSRDPRSLTNMMLSILSLWDLPTEVSHARIRSSHKTDVRECVLLDKVQCSPSIAFARTEIE